MSKFIIKKATSGEFYFNLKAGNGEIILTSEMYKARDSAVNGIASVKKNATDPSRFEPKLSTGNKHYFVLKAGNHEVIGKSEMYNSEDALNNGIKSVKDNAPSAVTEDLTA
jgi:uncharacterized protein